MTDDIFLYKMDFSDPCNLLSMKRGVNMRVSHLVKQAKKGNKEALLQLIMADKAAYSSITFYCPKQNGEVVRF